MSEKETPAGPAGSGPQKSNPDSSSLTQTTTTTATGKGKPGGQTKEERRAAAVAASARKTASGLGTPQPGHVSSAYGAPFNPFDTTHNNSPSTTASPRSRAAAAERVGADITNRARSGSKGAAASASNKKKEHEGENSEMSTRGQGPSIITKSINPKEGSSKDTTVNVATAFRSAATTTVSASMSSSGGGAATFLGRAGDNRSANSQQQPPSSGHRQAAASQVPADVTPDSSFESIPAGQDDTRQENPSVSNSGSAKKRKKPSSTSTALPTSASKRKETGTYRPSKSELQTVSSDEFESDEESVDLEELRFELGDGPAKPVLPSELQQPGSGRKRRRPTKKPRKSKTGEEGVEEEEQEEEEEAEEQAERSGPSAAKGSRAAGSRRRSSGKNADGTYRPGETDEDDEDGTAGNASRRRGKARAGRLPGRELRDTSVMSDDAPSQAQTVTSFYLRAPDDRAETSNPAELVQTQPRSQNYQPHFAYSTRVNGQHSSTVPAILRGRDADQDDTTSQASGSGTHHNESSNYSFDQRGSEYGYENEEAYVRAIERQDRRQKPGIPVGRQVREVSLEPTQSERSVDSLTVPQQQQLFKVPRKLPPPPGPNGGSQRSRSPSVLSDTGSTTANNVKSATQSRGSMGRKLGEAVRMLLTLGYWLTVKPILWLKEGDASRLWKWAAVIALLGLILGSMNERSSQPSHTKSAWHIPFLSRPARPSSPTFSAPTTLPTNFEEIVHRLTTLESTVSTCSDYQATEHHAFSDLSEQHSGAVKRLAALESDFESERSKSTRAYDALVKSGQKEAKEAESEMKGLRSQLDSLSDRLKTLSSEHKSDVATIAKVQSELSGVNKEIEGFSRKMSLIDEELKRTQAGQEARLESMVIKAIEEVLPSKMAVSVDSRSGQVKIDPAFWSHLRSAFAEAGSSPSTGSSSRPGDWNDFLVANADNLRSFMGEEVEGRIGRGAILSKKAFLELLQREIAGLRTEMSTSTSESLLKLSDELSAKLTKAASASSHANSGKVATIKFSSAAGEQELDAFVQSLIARALDKYSKDVLGQPDFALYSGGARIIHEDTSPIYQYRAPGWDGALASRTTGFGIEYGKPPVWALHPDISVGQCWAFNGSKGQLGVTLSRRILPSDITIEHASRDLAVDVSTAPKRFEVYGTDKSDPQTRATALERMHAYQQESGAELSDWVLLVAGEYDAFAESNIQTFPVQQAVRDAEIPIDTIKLYILDNHGNEDVTCLYRVRAGGKAVGE